MKMWILFLGMWILSSGVCLAEPSVPQASPEPTTAPAKKKSQRKKEIDFEDKFVEGVNKTPLDDMEQVGERDREKQPQLFHKRQHFHEEFKQQSKILRFGQ